MTDHQAPRDRVGARLEQRDRRVLPGAAARGLTTAHGGPLDGTPIAADASRHRRLDPARSERPPEGSGRVIAANSAGRDAGAIPARMARQPATRRRRHRSGEARRGPLKEHARDARRPGDRRQEPDEIVISAGDPETAPGRDEEEVLRPPDDSPVVQGPPSPPVSGREVFARATGAGASMPSRRRASDLTGLRLREIPADTGYAPAPDPVDRARADGRR